MLLRGYRKFVEAHDNCDIGRSRRVGDPRMTGSPAPFASCHDNQELLRYAYARLLEETGPRQAALTQFLTARCIAASSSPHDREPGHDSSYTSHCLRARSLSRLADPGSGNARPHRLA
jgi:hypothetical protein